jgi:hypothetical protein
MGLTAADAARYENAVRRLFPQGEYWDAQFAGPQSGVPLFARAKAAELARFIERKNALLGESNAETTAELIADWERVYLDEIYPGFDINQRRLQLKSAAPPRRARHAVFWRWLDSGVYTPSLRIKKRFEAEPRRTAKNGGNVRPEYKRRETPLQPAFFRFCEIRG